MFLSGTAITSCCYLKMIIFFFQLMVSVKRFVLLIRFLQNGESSKHRMGMTLNLQELFSFLGTTKSLGFNSRSYHNL